MNLRDKYKKDNRFQKIKSYVSSGIGYDEKVKRASELSVSEIEELIQYCIDMELPYEKTFIRSFKSLLKDRTESRNNRIDFILNED